jgi:hypothetical protein
VLPGASITRAHVFAEPGTYAVSLSVVDDDTGVGEAVVEITVADAAGGTTVAAEELNQALGLPGLSAASATALQQAIDLLIANNSGAFAMLERGTLIPALIKMAQAVGKIENAEAATPGLDLRLAKMVITSAAKSAVFDVIENAAAAGTLSGQKLVRAREAFEQGNVHRAADEFVDAIESYRTSIQGVQSL